MGDLLLLDADPAGELDRMGELDPALKAPLLLAIDADGPAQRV